MREGKLVSVGQKYFCRTETQLAITFVVIRASSPFHVEQSHRNLLVMVLIELIYYKRLRGEQNNLSGSWSITTFVPVFGLESVLYNERLRDLWRRIMPCGDSPA